jgi:hypothetical protein
MTSEKRKRQARLVVEVGEDLLRHISILAAIRGQTVKGLITSLVDTAIDQGGVDVRGMAHPPDAKLAHLDADLEELKNVR